MKIIFFNGQCGVKLPSLIDFWTHDLDGWKQCMCLSLLGSGTVQGEKSKMRNEAFPRRSCNDAQEWRGGSLGRKLPCGGRGPHQIQQ